MDEKRQSGEAGPHVGTKRLIAYRQGMLAPAERESVQEHLSLCPRCARLLLELRDFEAAAAGAVDASSNDAGPEPLRQEAWESLVRRLPPPPPRMPQTPRTPRLLYAAAAALLIGLLGLSAWMAVSAQRSRERLTHLEQELKQREDELEAARGQSSGRVAELEARVAALTSDLEKLRASPLVIASREIEVSVAPRFVLRGQEPSETDFLRGNGKVNSLRMPAGEDRFTLALSLAGQGEYAEYRLDLTDRDGKVLWTGRRPGNAFQGDAGSSVSIRGLEPGRYRLRVEGLRPDRTELLAEYVLAVERQQ